MFLSKLGTICTRMDFREANIPAASFHTVAAILAIFAMMSTDWILIEDMSAKNGTLDIGVLQAAELYMKNTEPCHAIGCHDFWEAVRFGGYIDDDGKSHVAFHTPSRVIVDCITPSTANYFYILIALCFVISATSSLCATMSLLPPPAPFLSWLRVNSILEMSNMMLTLCCCTIAIVAQTDISDQRPEDIVAIGAGVFLVCISGLLSFLAAMASIRQSNRKSRMRRIDNQRLLCARSLRSWRDAGRRAEDVRPIVDFERYLDDCTELEQTSSQATTHSNPAV
uniref:TMEM127 domain-containing protein n=1 Tax=Caenorhabditis tropicalis TaxID=1561998 RepID=A0A1I7TCS9_9PELO